MTLQELMDLKAPAAGNGKIGVKELTVKEIVQISAWLSGNAKALERSTSATRIAALEKATGVVCSDSQLRRVERELGYEFLPARNESNRESPVRTTDVLVAAMLDLYERLGEKPPEFLKFVAGHRSREEIAASLATFRAGRGV